MKNILAITALCCFIIVQNACNKPDAGNIVGGTYTFSSNTIFIKYKYKIVADTFQLTFLDQQFFFTEPYPTVVIKKESTTKASFLQQVPGDTIGFNNAQLYLEGGGTLLKTPIQSNIYLNGSVIGYELQYDIVDTTNKEMLRVSKVSAPKGQFY